MITRKALSLSSIVLGSAMIVLPITKPQHTFAFYADVDGNGIKDYVEIKESPLNNFLRGLVENQRSVYVAPNDGSDMIGARPISESMYSVWMNGKSHKFSIPKDMI